MNAQEFTYWLQGWMELENPDTVGPKQTQVIKDHLALVFNKKTPDRNLLSAQHPEKLYPGINFCSQEPIRQDCDFIGESYDNINNFPIASC